MTGLPPAGTTVTLGDSAGTSGVLDLYGCEQDRPGFPTLAAAGPW